MEGIQAKPGKLHPLPVGLGREDLPTVMDTVGNHGPAIVPSADDEVQLIAPSRTVFVRPDLSCFRMQGEPLHVSDARSSRSRKGVPSADEGVIRRNPAVVVETDDGPHVVGQILRRMVPHHVGGDHPVADRDEQVAVVVEDHPS